MWFALGLVSLILVLAAQIRHRWVLPWSGVAGVLPRTPRHRYRYLQRKDSYLGIEVGVPVPEFFRFELKRERWADRFFKWVGLSVEKQFGHDGFDQLVYVASDDQHLLNRVADSPELRDTAARLFIDVTEGCRLRHVRCAHGWLVARLDRGTWIDREKDAHRLERAMGVALKPLDRLAEALRHTERPELPQGRRDPYLLPGVVLVSISSALGINGLIFLFRTVVLDDAFLVDAWPVIEWAFWAGSGLLGLLLMAHLWLLGRSARAHLYLLELLLLGSFGAYATAAIEIREANIAWDTAPAVIRSVPAVDKTVSRSRRGGTSYFVHVTDWSNPADIRRIRVSRDVFDARQPGRRLMFEERPGRLGAPWARLIGLQPVPIGPT